MNGRHLKHRYPQHHFFDVSPEHIAALDDEGLRLLIARLCEADVRRRGLPTSAVLYGGNQIAADGGIDVRVELAANTDISGFIPRPVTGVARYGLKKSGEI